ncbi:hypothetical protein COY52_00975 [Candidatus Desantisbacteria bacterium CG_4_10_14_0_8_um_filter_48_22]|uniref:Citrate transporter-like domain-containing protein n=1 Tax=Candidatus Desantisbacteria bacterium CG_4_10_14_0_8_um_filter_48_22 TaxID=1974543 RepID=A0A2M7SFU8_9BACT|nr:MAG: hypothetical protein COS16_03190 [Candidatus Desantisbacteria bacterium CG02_land_8_20_14_3_00_49_13]PIZ18163.1 MAG: hypothetical protein COY52_00975 [Candidatus Desantisbacteria bacterium CG_4_10_14_0_8_um_filter_48_22]PJB28217.1 MAG: hypothetical protein CO111_02170 [Candidatus Desantisbacteria bacterium CG_4_9_14_3_um_filter_50_7]
MSIAFVGIGILLATKTLDVENFVKFSSLDVICFLVGMMTIVGMLKDVGFFNWIMMKLIRGAKGSATRFLTLLCVSSTLLACLVDEVTSIIFIAAIILEACDYFEVDPTPYIISSVLATNIGSSGTMLGNPIGILIGMRAGLTFESFIKWAFPVTMAALALTLLILRIWYRKDLLLLGAKMKEKLSSAAGTAGPGTAKIENKKDFKIGISIFVATILMIAFHHRIEVLCRFPQNTMLLAAPLIGAGVVMFWKAERARHYIEKDVDWWTLIFFMMLFAKAGTLRYTGVTDILANKIVAFSGSNITILIMIVLWISCFGSSILDNVVLVSAIIPVIQSFKAIGINVYPLWWALLFGGCFGGNITMVGSTANIVAIGMLEKQGRKQMKFFRWFRIGATVGVISTAVAGLLLLILFPFMPKH